jgi:hypothetical protein
VVEALVEVVSGALVAVGVCQVVEELPVDGDFRGI